MWDSIKQTFGKYFLFGGRAGRREFWTWTFIVLAISVVAVCILAAIAFIFGNTTNHPVAEGLFHAAFILLGVFWLVMFLPSLTVSVRRLRDAGISPWFLLIPITLCIVTFLVLADIGLSNMDGSTARYSDAFAFILSAITAVTVFVFLFLFCLPSKK